MTSEPGPSVGSGQGALQPLEDITCYCGCLRTGDANKERERERDSQKRVADEEWGGRGQSREKCIGQ